MDIVRATIQDVDTVLAIIGEAADWLRSRSIDQWGWALSARGRDILLTRIAEEEVYIAREDGYPVGTITIQWRDRLFWDDKGEDGLAGYVHGLAILRAASGRGLGRQLLTWATGVISAHGKQYVRLDCLADNQVLHAYYEVQGFSRVGTKALRDYTCALYEKPVSAAGQPPATPPAGSPRRAPPG